MGDKRIGSCHWAVFPLNPEEAFERLLRFAWSRYNILHLSVRGPGLLRLNDAGPGIKPEFTLQNFLFRFEILYSEEICLKRAYRKEALSGSVPLNQQGEVTASIGLVQNLLRYD